MWTWRTVQVASSEWEDTANTELTSGSVSETWSQASSSHSDLSAKDILGNMAESSTGQGIQHVWAVTHFNWFVCCSRYWTVTNPVWCALWIKKQSAGWWCYWLTAACEANCEQVECCVCCLLTCCIDGLSLWWFFTAHCSAESGYAMVTHLSACNIGVGSSWNSRWNRGAVDDSQFMI